MLLKLGNGNGCTFHPFGHGCTFHPFPETECVSSIQYGGGVKSQLALVLLHNVAQPGGRQAALNLAEYEHKSPTRGRLIR
jgi:hypothetical protein